MHQELERARKNPFDRFPPRLSMEAYVDYVSESLQRVDPEKAKRQKMLEERIINAFVWMPCP